MDIINFKILNTAIERLLNQKMNELGITYTQATVIGYLNLKKDTLVFQKDIEINLGLTHPTVSSILKRLEEKSLIKTEVYEEDKRLKKITLTKNSYEILGQIQSKIDEMGKLLFSGISSDEIKSLDINIRKIIQYIMEMKKLSQIIKENLNASIKEFINEDVNGNNDPNKLLGDFSVNLNVYFDREQQKLMRKMRFAEEMKNEVFQINKTIMGLGYEFSKIETSEYRGEYIINYYIANAENWSDDEFMEHEDNITSNFRGNNLANYDISVDVNEDMQGSVFISLTFNLKVIDELDV